MRMLRTLPALLTVFVLITVISSTTAQGQGPKPIGLRPNAPAYARHGPFWVGTRELVISDPVRPLPITVWYPALNPTGLPEELTYPSDYPPFAPGPLPIKGHALLDAALAKQGSPFPGSVRIQNAPRWRGNEGWMDLDWGGVRQRGRRQTSR